MEENPSELVASNQQNQNQNSEHYVNCNICQRVFKTNRGLLQHLSFCRKRNRENTINSNAAINDSNNAAATSGKSDNHNYIRNGDYKTYIWNMFRGTILMMKLQSRLHPIRIRIYHVFRSIRPTLIQKITYGGTSLLIPFLLTLTKYTTRSIGTTKICSKFLQDSVENSLLTN